MNNVIGRTSVRLDVRVTYAFNRFLLSSAIGLTPLRSLSPKLTIHSVCPVEIINEICRCLKKHDTNYHHMLVAHKANVCNNTRINCADYARCGDIRGGLDAIRFTLVP
jgi:hypothetical protein